jgi:hypothetical protein
MLDIPPGKPRGFPIQIAFTLNSSGLLDVVATERQSGTELRMTVQIGGMSEEAVEDARVSLSRERVS